MGLRQQRLADEIMEVVASVFRGGILEDPRLQGVTITGAKLSADLQICTLYFRLYNPDQEKQALLGLERVNGFLRTKLAEKLRIRRIPELRFFYDKSVERGENIERLLEQIKNES